MDRRLLVVQIAGMFVVFALCLFGAAGTVRWSAGWVFLALFFGFTIALSLWLMRTSPDLLTERMTGIGKPDQKGWDKVFFGLANVAFVTWLIVMPLDAVRFGWSVVPPAVRLAGAAMMLASFALFFAVFGANAYLSPAVRIQSERGHRVVDAGPYAVVRHPMYGGALLLLVGASLLLGSWFGLVPLLVLAAGIAWRAVQEEKTLRDELDGYADYMRRVRWRLVPGVW